MNYNDYSGEVVDVEVARYGLRTFQHVRADELELGPNDLWLRAWSWLDPSIWGGEPCLTKPDGPMEFCSTAMRGSNWKHGVCEASCQVPVNSHQKLLIELAALTMGDEPVFSHQAPQEDCHCGIYAAHTLQVLKEQFASYTNDIVAVVAAEGQTIIGDKGFRTQRARVVAYWCSNEVAATAQGQFSEAQRYSDIASMLADYGLEHGTPSPDRYGWAGVISGGGGGGGGVALLPSWTVGWEPPAQPPKKVQAISNRTKMAMALNLAISAANFGLYFWLDHVMNLVAAVVAFAIGVSILVIGVNK
jgi:hypothetical protein